MTWLYGPRENTCLQGTYSGQHKNNHVIIYKYSPKSHMDGKNLLHIVGGQLICVIWIINIINTHYPTQLPDLLVPEK